MSTKLEPLTPYHAAVVSELHRLCFNEHWSPDEFKDLINSPARFGIIILQGESPVGFLLCQGDEVESEIITIATHPKMRKMGFAQKMMDHLVTKSRRILLDVATDNKSALSFYLAYGFQEISRRKNYYNRPHGQRVDAIVMEYGT